VATTTTEAAPPPEAAPETTSARDPDFMRQGDEGPRIGLIQFKLVALGYLPPGGDTGVFDSATNSAVLEFQGDYGLIVDGIIGPETERAISAAAESINPEQPPQ
jgi:peptidoglycan hydrolase-like protein with peptidoglycan-binding domain